MPEYDINNWRTDRDWCMKTNQKEVKLTAGCNADDPHSLLFYFQQVFPLEHLPIMTVLTNIQLQLIDKPITNQEEILKFFGVLLLILHMPNMPHWELWDCLPKTKYSIAANLEKMGTHH